jgi:hypothetical protein
MAITDEELATAEQARAIVGTLGASSTLHPNDVATLRNARNVAILAMTTGGGPLNDARYKVGIALEVKRGPLTQEKIAEAKGAIEDWMKLLKAKQGHP